MKKRQKDYRQKMKENYDRRHQVVAHEEMSQDDRVWIPDQRKEGKIIKNHEAQRSVLIQIADSSVLRRNQQMARKLYQPTVPPDTVKDCCSKPDASMCISQP